MNRSIFRKAALRLCAAALFFAVAPTRSQTPIAPSRPLPNLHLISIGVSQYLDASNTLRFPAQDALAVARVFQEQQGNCLAALLSLH